MNGRVDPSSSLRQQNAESIWDDSLAHGLRAEDHFALGERLEHERGEIPIFTKEKQVLLVEGVDNVLRIMFDYIGICEDGYPVAIFVLRCFDAIHGETSG